MRLPEVSVNPFIHLNRSHFKGTIHTSFETRSRVLRRCKLHLLPVADLDTKPFLKDVVKDGIQETVNKIMRSHFQLLSSSPGHLWRNHDEIALAGSPTEALPGGET
jgi:hypothetical protein